MDRCALFVDAGYVLADGAMAVHGTRRRESVSWDYPGLLQLLEGLATERSRLPLLRCYWYDSTVEGRRSADHETLADLPGVKLRVARMRPGRREGVGSEIHRDLTTLARNKAVSDAVVVSAEEDLGEVISDVQDMGMRVTLLYIPVDGDPTISRALLQECDDVAEISAEHLRPYVELISGAEPPRPDERDGAALALPPGTIVNGNGHAPHGPGPSAGRAAAYAQQAPVSPAAGDDGQHVPVVPPAPAAYVTPEPEVPAFPERGFQERAGQDKQLAQPRIPAADSRDGGRGVVDYGRPIEYGAAGYGAPKDVAAADNGYAPDNGYVPDYGNFAGYGPGVTGFDPAPADPPSLRQDQAVLRQDQVEPGRQELRADRPADAELPARDELYGVPVPLPLPMDKPPVERQPARIRQDGDPSGYSPGAVREQFRQDPHGTPGTHGTPVTQGREPLADDADRYQPVPAGTAQVRRLPTRGAPAEGPAAGQPAVGQSAAVPQALSQMPPAPGTAASPVMPGGPAEAMNGQPSAGHPVAPVVPMAPGGMMGYSGGRSLGPNDPGAGHQGGLPAVSQPLSAPVAQAAPAVPVIPGIPAGPAAQREPDFGQLGPVSTVGPAAYPVGQSGVSLAEAVQSAHDEGQDFGDSVARDAPALWLEAVLARKPRMPSDLEARLLQGSSLPIDFLLHDEVRHALRRGFWDAMERARR